MAKKEKKIKGLDVEELKKNLITLRDKLMNLKFKAEGAKSKNVKEAKTLKREVAQILTELNKSNKK